MAKKRAPKAGKPARPPKVKPVTTTTKTSDVGQPREDWNRKPLVIQMRGSEAWKEWVEMVARVSRIAVAGLVDQAIAEYAKNRGIKEEPPER